MPTCWPVVHVRCFKHFLRSGNHAALQLFCNQKPRQRFRLTHLRDCFHAERNSHKYVFTGIIARVEKSLLCVLERSMRFASNPSAFELASGQGAERRGTARIYSREAFRALLDRQPESKVREALEHGNIPHCHRQDALNWLEARATAAEANSF